MLALASARRVSDLPAEILFLVDLAFAWALADRVAIMYLGKIVELGPAQTVLTGPFHPYTKFLLTVTPEVGRRRTQEVLTGEPPDPAHIPPGCRFHPRCPVLRSGEAGSQEPRCLGEVPALGERVPGHRAACHVAAARARSGRFAQPRLLKVRVRLTPHRFDYLSRGAKEGGPEVVMLSLQKIQLLGLLRSGQLWLGPLYQCEEELGVPEPACLPGGQRFQCTLL